MQNIIAAPQAAAPAAVTTPYAVGNFDKGNTKTSLSSQWMMRPDDQRFLSLTDLRAHVDAAAQESWHEIVNVHDVRVNARRDDPNDLRLVIPTASGREVQTAPNHWSFGQLCSLVQVPAAYLRKLPSSIAGINLQFGLQNFREESVKAYVRENGKTELRAATGPDYGRVLDREIVDAVMRIAGNGTGDTNWKVPGMLNWGNMLYDPLHPISKQTTTLFASDRDVFVFLVDDTHPIEIGKLPNGDPDLIFRGFMVWNSEVGSKSLGVATMYLRAICCNRILWGVEGYSEITLRHSKNAPMRLDAEVRPALESYANASTSRLLTGIREAREAIVARTDDDRKEFLGRQGFSKPEAAKIIATVFEEEQKEPESVWDFVQGITAYARTVGRTDDRVAVEKTAGKLLDKVTGR